MKPQGKTPRIVGLGSALVDILVHESDDFVRRIGVEKGGMTLVDMPTLEKILNQVSGAPIEVPGGSACNTAVGVGQLNGCARFVGKRGNDDLGRFFEKALVERGVEPFLMTSDLPTGRVLSIITPDAQRTMITYLGASADTRPEEITAQCFHDSAVVHMEGYLLFNPDLMAASLNAAKKAGAKVSLDLASFTVVEQSQTLLEDIIRRDVDILIANEDEARAYTGLRDEARALARLARHVDTAALKIGARGSFIQNKDQVYRIPAQGSGQAVDTTGAGDLWASGFLYGLVNGYPHEKSGRLASACGYEVCQVVGADIPADGWMRIKEELEE
ncbi:adenosine kinase [Desulfosarcina alkanivorans]|uniref:Adenosine kinase n=1 Tax=Desulfosarcina alkanivorans TaxID=571177 RepID=A0A5K7YMS5_9BACT|nr:adenosine kinase [Desulfosarcina alkanivorans]BBO70506.1 adenosine kinase [Desulfosarcina alkanivorans]